ncbi:MAG: hypothetical protein Q4G05_04045 [Clostridia bacterium]|nr:hypothetical protein [Clostridia bacterium]
MKKTIIYILTFILSIFIILLIGLILADTTILNEKYIIKKMEKSNYYQKIYDITNEDFKKHTLQSGFGDEIIDNIIDKEIIKEDINSLVGTIYTKSGYTIHSQEIRSRLETNIENKIKTGRYVITEGDKSNIETFKNTIVKAYANNIIYGESIVDVLKSTVTKVNSLMNMIYIGILFVIIVLIVLLNTIDKDKKVQFLQVALLTTGLFFIFVSLFMRIGVNFDNILMFNKEISKLFINIINNILLYMGLVGAVVISLIIIKNLIWKGKSNG